MDALCGIVSMGIVSRFEKMWYRGLRTCDGVVSDEDVDGSHEDGGLMGLELQMNDRRDASGETKRTDGQ